MNMRQIEGKWKALKGSVTETLGKWLGNESLKQSGEAEKVRGKIQSAAAGDGPVSNTRS